MGKKKKLEWFPPVNFYFQVFFIPKSGGSGKQVSFQEVSGLGWEIGADTKVNHPRLVLKRPIGMPDEAFTQWVQTDPKTANYPKENIHDIVIKLLDMEGKPLAVWFCAHAHPVRYTIGEMNAEESKILMETVEIAYERLERKQ